MPAHLQVAEHAVRKAISKDSNTTARSTSIPSMSSLGEPRSTSIPSMSALGEPRSTSIPSMSALGEPRSTSIPSMSAFGEFAVGAPSRGGMPSPKSPRSPSPAPGAGRAKGRGPDISPPALSDAPQLADLTDDRGESSPEARELEELPTHPRYSSSASTASTSFGQVVSATVSGALAGLRSLVVPRVCDKAVASSATPRSTRTSSGGVSGRSSLSSDWDNDTLEAFLEQRFYAISPNGGSRFSRSLLSPQESDLPDLSGSRRRIVDSPQQKRVGKSSKVAALG